MAEQAPREARRIKRWYAAQLDTEKLTKADKPPPPEWDDLVASVEVALSEAFLDGGSEAFEETGATAGFSSLNKRARAYAEKRSAELVGRRYDADGNLVENPNAKWAITETTRDDIQRVVTRAFDDGLTPDDLADEIEKIIDDPNRAELIARTELAKAQTSGSLAGWRESGLVAGKRWLLSNNHEGVEDNDHERVEDECDENADAGVIPIEEPFPSGDLVPGAHPRCECDVAAELEEDSAEAA